MDYENNIVKIFGKVCGGFTLSHYVFKEGFYMMTVEVERNSGTVDSIPVMVSERIVDVEKDLTGMYVEVSGQFRSHNIHEENGNRLTLFVFATKIEILDEPKSGKCNNHVFLDGFVCKKPAYRKTPLGREIADVLLAVNRNYRKSDYIPCICWGRNAVFASKLDAGCHVGIHGRIQSRKYTKKLENGEFEERIAYEISVSRLEELQDENSN